MNKGASGSKTIIIVGDKAYTTTALPPTMHIGQKTAAALITSGAAVPQVPTYLEQFPWTKPVK